MTTIRNTHSKIITACNILQ